VEPALAFSVSRAGPLVLVAVRSGAIVGVDVEALDRAGDWVGVADHFFTPGERTRLDEIAEARRADAFLTAWTVKEACLKADGRGVVAGLDGIDVLLDPDRPEQGLTVVSDPPWHVTTFAAGPGHVAAVASDQPFDALSGWEWGGPGPQR
jgi:4'-phosphopantetheinyl transferase